MKNRVKASIAAVAAAAVLTTAAPVLAAKATLMPQSSEKITPTAKGPKTYQATKLAECTENSCVVNFGKKPKLRRVSDLSCMMMSTDGVAVGAQIYVGERIVSYLPIVSRGINGNLEFATFLIAIDFDVPSGDHLKIGLASSDASATAANCTLIGTIE